MTIVLCDNLCARKADAYVEIRIDKGKPYSFCSLDCAMNWIYGVTDGQIILEEE